MQTAEAVCKSVLPIVFDDVPGELPVRFEMELNMLIAHSSYVPSLHSSARKY